MITLSPLVWITRKLLTVSYIIMNAKLGGYSIGGHSLNGFTPNINITIIEKGHQTSTQNLIQSVDYNFEKVLVDVAVPIGFEHPEMSLISQLPDGSFSQV